VNLLSKYLVEALYTNDCPFIHLNLGIFALWVGLSMQASASELRLAVDIAPIHSIVAQIAGDKVRLDLIVPVNASPHDHAEGNPHVWLGSQNAIAWAYVIAGALGEKDPQNSAL
jgi:ABC-type Zn uptake system ZnuABC Zn-binding protein ZnuA